MIHKSAKTPSLAVEAAELRREIIEALYACSGGHYGGSLSVLDLLLTLYRRILRTFPESPRHPDRDRLILSKGHSSIALYAVLRRLGFFDRPLSSHGQTGSPLEGHPDMTVLEGIDFSTGSLGQGLSVGLGMALALRGTERHTWVVLGDGECQEGQVWEAAMLAARYRVERLHAVIDANEFQEWGWNNSPEVNRQPLEELSNKWSAFGWRVLEVDGHDHEALATIFEDAASTKNQPSLVVARTIKGKGYPMIETDPIRFHCTTISELEHRELVRGGE
ncbi:MAG TPA: transketolase [Pyrinomonadaceae bacterium]|jgi:transketolase|nr:transketolase [Pyrinomonadaceae bacterium]